MAVDWTYLAIAIGCAAAITVALRALPFVVRGALEDSALLANLNAWMPLGVTTILVVYCLSDIGLPTSSPAIAQVVAVVATVAVHWWKRNVFLSLAVGTITCVGLANWVLPAL